MKKTWLSLLFFFFAAVFRLFPLDLKLSGGLGNLAFEKGRTEALSAVDGEFEPKFFPLALAQLSGEYKDQSYNVGFERDPILRNRLFANVRTNLGYFSLETGPVVSLFNSSRLPISPGISVGMGLSIPGIIFIEAVGSSTLGILMDTPDNNFQRTGDISAGFWVPHVICSFNLNYKNFTYREQDNLLIEDGLVRYYFRADVYTKNIPYTIRLDVGFEKLSRSYTSQAVSGTSIVRETDTDEFKSVFIGLQGTYSINPALKIFLGGEIPVYSWGSPPMKDPPRSTFFFQAWTGIIWTLPNRNS